MGAISINPPFAAETAKTGIYPSPLHPRGTERLKINLALIFKIDLTLIFRALFLNDRSI